MSTTINHVNGVLPAPVSATAPRRQSVEQLDAALLPHAEAILADWFGQTQTTGGEITMRNPLRDDKNLGSFKFNATTGGWSDFAVEDCKGYGLTTLYMAVYKVSITDAMAALDNLSQGHAQNPQSAPVAEKRARPRVEAVNPDDVILPPDIHPDLGGPSVTWEYRDGDNKLSFHVYRFDRDGNKETRPLSWSPAKSQWLWQYAESPFPLYHLPDLLARPDAAVVVTEGEKAADAAARQFPDAVAVTSACGSQQALCSDWAVLKGRNVIVAPDKDAPGRNYALSVAGAALAHGASSVRVVDVWQLPDWKTGDDLADHVVQSGFLDTAVAASELFEQTELEPHVVAAAARLSLGDFDRNKAQLAKGLGIGVRTFEGLVRDARIRDKDDAEPERSTAMFADDDLEPWDTPVDGDALFDEIIALINRFVVLAPSQAVAVAAWIVMSWCFEAVRLCPKLLINSPSKRCGKSTLMELIMYMVHRPMPAANISAAAIFRSIDLWKPTLLIDEADTFLNRAGNEEIVGILNSGHTRAMAFVVRTQEVEGRHEPVRFSVYCPQVVAMIKTPADTLIDRSIVITLTRKLSGQAVDAMALDTSEQLSGTRRRIARWKLDNLKEVRYDVDAIPMIGNDRARQNWAVLAAFTMALGMRAHAALLKAATDLADTSGIEENIETDLLADIREMVRGLKQAHIQSTVLSQTLGKMQDRPWCEINQGRALTGHQLARRLKPFKVVPEKFRDGATTHRGYSIAALNAVFDRYLPASAEVSA